LSLFDLSVDTKSLNFLTTSELFLVIIKILLEQISLSPSLSCKVNIRFFVDAIITRFGRPLAQGMGLSQQHFIPINILAISSRFYKGVVWKTMGGFTQNSISVLS
jgi:hypothetical protein